MNYTYPDLPIGDRVRIQEHPITQEKKVAGLIGICYGFSTPSGGHVPKEEIIGELIEDRVYSVHFDDLEEPMWFASHLVEFVAHDPEFKIELETQSRLSSPWKRFFRMCFAVFATCAFLRLLNKIWGII